MLLPIASVFSGASGGGHVLPIIKSKIKDHHLVPSNKSRKFLKRPKNIESEAICAVEYQFYKKDTRCGQLNELH